MVEAEEGDKGRIDSVDDKETWNSQKYALMILKTEKFLYFEDSDDLYRYEDGVYKEKAETYVKMRCVKLLGNKYSSHRGNEVVDYIKYSDNSNIKRLRNHDDVLPLNLIPLANGIYNLLTDELRPYTSDDVVFARLPVSFDRNATCPLTKKFLAEVADEEDQDVIQEFPGYLLYRANIFGRSLVLVGTGDNGKSTLLRLLTKLLGGTNVSNVTLQSLCENRFAAAQLLNKYANIFADLPPRGVSDVGIFKAITGNDRISVERKNRDAYSTLLFTKLLFSCNALPTSYDDSDAFYRRWIILKFSEVFHEGAKNTDPNLLDKLTGELSGLLNYALEGLRRLLKNQKFSYNKTIEENRELYDQQSGSVETFVRDMLYTDDEAEITKEDAFEAYKKYCEWKNIIAVSKKMFAIKLQYVMNPPSIRSSQVGRPWCWKGIKLAEDTENRDEAKETTIDSY